MKDTIATIIAKSGILPEETLRQYQKWGLLAEIKDTPAPKSAEEFIQRIQQALEEDNIALIKETDLDIMVQYVRTQRIGSLRVSYGEEEPQRTIEVSFGRTLSGEYIIPWSGEDITELMTNGHTHLSYKHEMEGATKKKLEVLSSVFFSSVRETYFDGLKVFMVCVGQGDVPWQTP